MRASISSYTRILSLLFIGVVVGCSDGLTTSPEESIDTATALSGQEPVIDDVTALHRGHDRAKRRRVRRLVRDLRRKTSRFRRLEVAMAHGYETQVTQCRESDAGGMGFHYGDLTLFDGVVERLRPEVLLFEPTRRGRMRFVAVEYIVPFAAWTNEEPPELDGFAFHRSEADGVWILHVWHRKWNPSGTLADWNPRVSCRYASDGTPPAN